MKVTPKNHYCSPPCWSEREKNLWDKMGFDGSALVFFFVVPPELLCWSTDLISTKSRTKIFFLYLVYRCPFLASISLVTHIQCLKIAKVVERDLRDVNLREA